MDHIKDNKLGGICYFSDLKISPEITKEMKKIYDQLKHSLPKYEFEEPVQEIECDNIVRSKPEELKVEDIVGSFSIDIQLDTGDINGTLLMRGS